MRWRGALSLRVPFSRTAQTHTVRPEEACPLSHLDVKDIRALNLPRVLSRSSRPSSQKGHSESLRVSDRLFLSLSLSFLDVVKWVTIHSKAEIPVRSLVRVSLFPGFSLRRRSTIFSRMSLSSFLRTPENLFQIFSRGFRAGFLRFRNIF